MSAPTNTGAIRDALRVRGEHRRADKRRRRRLAQQRQRRQMLLQYVNENRPMLRHLLKEYSEPVSVEGLDIVALERQIGILEDRKGSEVLIAKAKRLLDELNLECFETHGETYSVPSDFQSAKTHVFETQAGRSLLGLPVVLDPTMPRDEVRLVGGSGTAETIKLHAD